MVGKGLQHGIGQGVDGVRGNQVVHIQGVGVGGVFHAGAGPEQAGGGHGIAWLAEELLPIPIGGLRQGQRGFALQVRRQLRVERGVDAGDEKAGHQLRRGLACALRQALLIGLVGA